MKYKSYYSDKLNMIVDHIGKDCTIEDSFEMASRSIRLGKVNSNTRILTIVEWDSEFKNEELREVSRKSLHEFKEYRGTRTAVLTRGVWSTVGAMKASSDLADRQLVRVFSTISRALEFLGLTRAEVEGAFPDVVDVLEVFDD